MNNELNKYLIENTTTVNKGRINDALDFLLENGNTGDMAEKYYAEKRNASLMPKNFKGYDLDDKTEIKSATSSWTGTSYKITINGLTNKYKADLIIIIYNDLANKVIAEVTVTPNDIKKVDGTMPKDLNIAKKDFRTKFADKTKILATY